MGKIKITSDKYGVFKSDTVMNVMDFMMQYFSETEDKALELANKDEYKEQYIDLYAMRLVHLEADYSEPRVIVDEIYIEDINN